MLWPVTKPVESGLYLLDEIYTNFYTNLFEGNRFDACFSVDFSGVLNASQKTRDLFQSVFDLYRDLDGAHKDSFQEIYDNHSNISQAFSDDQFEVMRHKSEHKEIWNAVKKLSCYLYSTTMGLRSFTDIIGNDGMNTHFEEFKALNGVVCCFCGTEEMMEEREILPDDDVKDKDEKQWRASYDHYLPKKHYPFLSVDFENLIPCCQKCNEKAKQEIDVLYNQKGERTLAFLPYIDAEGVSLRADYEKQNDTFNMRVDIINTGDQRYKKAQTWNRTFQILPRINQRLKMFNNSWLAPVLCRISKVDEAKLALSDESIRCHNSRKQERDAYFKSLCFYNLSNKSNQEIQAMIEAVNQTYGRRSI